MLLATYNAQFRSSLAVHSVYTTTTQTYDLLDTVSYQALYTVIVTDRPTDLDQYVPRNSAQRDGDWLIDDE